jgi:hypothetical protein
VESASRDTEQPQGIRIGGSTGASSDGPQVIRVTSPGRPLEPTPICPLEPNPVATPLLEPTQLSDVPEEISTRPQSDATIAESLQHGIGIGPSIHTEDGPRSHTSEEGSIHIPHSVDDEPSESVPEPEPVIVIPGSEAAESVASEHAGAIEQVIRVGAPSMGDVEQVIRVSSPGREQRLAGQDQPQIPRLGSGTSASAPGPQVIRVTSPRPEYLPISTVHPPSSEAPQVVRVGTSRPESAQVIRVTSPRPEPVVVPAVISEPPRVVRIGGSSCPSTPQVVRITSPPREVVAPVAPIVSSSSEPPHVIRVGGSSVAQEGPQVIRVTVPRVEVAPVSTAAPSIVPGPIAGSESPQIVRLGSSIPQEGPQVIRVTSPRVDLVPVPAPAPAPVLALEPASVVTSEPPHVVRLGSSVLQEGAQIIRITSPQPVAAPVV